MTAIPSGFHTVLLGDVAHIQTGGKDNQDKNPHGKYPFFVRSATVERIDSYSYDGEAILVPGEGRIGSIFHYVNGKFDTHQRVYRISEFSGSVVGRYVYYYMRLFFGEHAMTHSVKATVDSLRLPTFKRFEMTLPQSVAEQRRIAEALSDVDELIDALERVIAKKQDALSAARQALLSCSERLPSFAGEWREYALGDVATFSKGSGLAKADLSASGRECIHYGELFTDYGAVIHSVHSRTRADLPVESHSGDVLMPTSDVTPRGLAKASALLDDGVLLGGDILVIRPDRRQVDPRYLAYAIRNDADQVLSFVRGTTVYHIYASDMKQFDLLLPEVDEQRAIADVLADMDDEITALRRRLMKTRQVKRGMMQELLTGRTRLPVERTAA